MQEVSLDILQTIFTADYLPLVRRVVCARARCLRWHEREEMVSVAMLRAWEKFLSGHRAAAHWWRKPLVIAVWAWQYAFQRRYRLKQSDLLSTHRRAELGQAPLSEVDHQRSVPAELPWEIPAWVPDQYRPAALHAMSGGWLANPTIRALKRAYRETH
jgi:hypothetical protein